MQRYSACQDIPWPGRAEANKTSLTNAHQRLPHKLASTRKPSYQDTTTGAWFLGRSLLLHQPRGCPVSHNGGSVLMFIAASLPKLLLLSCEFGALLEASSRSMRARSYTWRMLPDVISQSLK